jgi:hypothetical protein
MVAMSFGFSLGAGATVSVYAITLDVQDKTQLLRKMLLQQNL